MGLSADYGRVERRGAYAVDNMRYFDELLAKQPFLAGDRYTMPDITLFAGLLFANMADLPIAPELISLHAWRSKMSAIPAVKDRTGQIPLAEDLVRRNASA